MIAIKINQNNSAEPGADHGNAMNANPQTCVAIVASLVKAGVPQADIWIGDPSRAVTDNISGDPPGIPRSQSGRPFRQ